MTLYRKYRPHAWSSVEGQEHVKTVLMHQLAGGTQVHAYLFSGPRGVGKTTIARIFALALGCAARGASPEPCGECAPCKSAAEGEAIDIVEMDAASHRGIDAVRDDIIEHSRFAPVKSKFKVYIIDEVHMMTTDAFNALLKTLEEPPSHVVFVLATTDPQKVPDTILSRCQRFEFRRIAEGAMLARLRTIVGKEQATADDAALLEIARRADGGLRDAESLLGKALAAAGSAKVTLETLHSVFPSADDANVRVYADALLRRDGTAAFGALATAATAGGDAETMAVDVVAALRQRLHAAIGGDKGKIGDIAAVLEILLDKQRLLRGVEPAELVLELTAVAICDAPSAARTPRAAAQAIGGRDAAVPAVPVKAPAAIAAPAPIAAASISMPAAPAVRIDVASVRAKWQAILDRVGENNHSLTFVLGGAQIVDAGAGVVKIGVTFPFHRQKLSEERAKTAMREALAAFVGPGIEPEYVLLEKNGDLEHTDGAPTHAAPALTADPLVAAFGGRLME